MSTHAIDIDKLAPAERLQLIGDLWDSLRAEPSSVPVTHEHREELDERLDELDTGAAELVDWDEAKRRLHRSV